MELLEAAQGEQGLDQDRVRAALEGKQAAVTKKYTKLLLDKIEGTSYLLFN